MAGKKAKKAKEELAWRDARSFVRSFEKWMTGEKGKIALAEGGKEADCAKLLGADGRRWVRHSYKKAEKREKTLFLKSIMYFMYLLGTGETGCTNLAKILGKMAGGKGRLGEFYEYILQNSDLKFGENGLRFGFIASKMKEGGLGEDYYKWFRKEFGSQRKAQEGGIRIPISTKTPKELRKGRKRVDGKALARKIYAPKGRLVGSAAMGRILGYLQTGKLTKLVFEDKAAARGVAQILHESGVDDISASGNRINMGLKETIYHAKKRIAEEGFGGSVQDVLGHLEYFSRKGIGGARINQAKKMLESGNAGGAIEEVCRIALKSCRERYLAMGEVKRSFGNDGREMVSAFKKHVGAEGDSSLLVIYDMVERGEYPSALGRLKRIFDAIEIIEGKYPHMF